MPIPLTRPSTGDQLDHISAMLFAQGIIPAQVRALRAGDLKMLFVSPSVAALAKSTLSQQPHYSRYLTRIGNVTMRVHRIGKSACRARVTVQGSSVDGAVPSFESAWRVKELITLSGTVLDPRRSDEGHHLFLGVSLANTGTANPKVVGDIVNVTTSYNPNGTPKTFDYGVPLYSASVDGFKLFGDALYYDMVITVPPAGVSAGAYNNYPNLIFDPPPYVWPNASVSFGVWETGTASLIDESWDNFVLVAGPNVMDLAEVVVFGQKIVYAITVTTQPSLITYMEGIRGAVKDGNTMARLNQQIDLLRVRPDDRYTAWLNLGQNPWALVDEYKEVASLLWAETSTISGVNLGAFRSRVEASVGQVVLGVDSGQATEASFESVYGEMTGASFGVSLVEGRLQLSRIGAPPATRVVASFAPGDAASDTGEIIHLASWVAAAKKYGATVLYDPSFAGVALLRFNKALQDKEAETESASKGVAMGIVASFTEDQKPSHVRAARDVFVALPAP